MKINQLDKDGLKHGLWEIRLGPKTTYSISYKRGKFHGPYTYYSNGNLFYKGEYKNDKRYGLWELFNSDGTPMSIEFYIT